MTTATPPIPPPPAAAVGRSLPRVEDERLLTGAGAYVADMRRDGQVWARVVRSSVAHARLLGIDASAALRRPDVLAVVSAEDLPDVRIPIRIAATPECEHALQPPLARDAVRYVGEPVAVVVATSAYAAEDAAEAVHVEVDPLDPVLDARRAAAGAGPALHAGLGGNVVSTLRATHGEPLDAVFEAADVVVRAELRSHRHAGVPIETRGLLAEHDPRSGRLTVWGPAKVKHFNRRALGALMDLPLEAIRFVEPDVGGSFGVRGEMYPEDFLVPWLARRLGRPVKWVEDRAEHFMAANHSREQECEIEVAAASDGALLGFRLRSWVDLGAYVRTQGMVLPRLTVRHAAGPYEWRAFEAEALGVLTDKTPCGTCRGPGQVEATFFRERALDLVAERLGIDPVALRERNLVPARRLPLTLDLGPAQEPMVCEAGDYPATLARLTEHVSYPRLRERVDARRARGAAVGIGVGAFIEEGGTGPWEQARVVAEPGGRFGVHVGVGAVGQGVGTALAQIAADALGVPFEAISVHHHDTDTVPEGLGAFASRATAMGGNAVAGAAADLVARARAAAAARLGVDPDAVEIAGGRAWAARGPAAGDSLPLDELGVAGACRFEKPTPSVSMGAALAVVEVDRETGGLVLERFALAYDVGRAVNPRLVVGQLVGGAAQGIAGALLERLAYDDAGQPLATSFMDYALATAGELPPIEALVLELATPGSPSNPLGVKGCGEGGTIAAAAALANALADALGERGAVTATPLVPEAVLDLVDAAARAPRPDAASAPR